MQAAAASSALPDVRALRADVEAELRDGIRDFSKRALEGVSLAGIGLDGICFQEADLDRADLANASLRGADLSRAALRQSNAPHADLESVNLEHALASEASFDSTNLKCARLVGARFDSAGFVAANLGEADASECDGSEADFSDAKALKASFARANLRGASFARADLTGVSFAGADLRGACFDDANLSLADLSGAQLAGASFARANLSGARVDGDLPYTADHENLRSLAEQDRGLIFSLLGVCAYVMVSVGTATDAQLALNRALVKLPVLDVELPLQLFFVGAAVVVFLNHLYLSLEQARLVRALGTLPSVFPDSAALVDRAHPWFVVVALANWFGPGDKKQSRLLTPAVVALAWGLAPSTIGVLLFRFLASQRTQQSYLLWALFAASVTLSFDGLLKARRAKGIARGRITLVASVVLALGLVGTLPGVLVGLHDFHLSAPRAALSTREGGEVRGADLERAPLSRADFRMAHLEQAALFGARLDFALLQNANLTGAQAEFATFEGADLSQAVLEHAVFFNGRLAGARLVGAQAPRADLRRADLRGVKANGINLQRALADSVHFDGADLQSAALQELRAPHASFEGADLTGADLSGAVLVSGSLRAAHLAGVQFVGTNLSQVDLTGVGANELTVDQLCQSMGWREALLPGDEAPDSRRPFRIDEPGPLRRQAEAICRARVPND